MGNRICRSRRGPVEERLTRPQRLGRQPSNVDYKKLRRLILSKKLAPCFDALEDPSVDLEECPICFFYYPSLNRSRCCAKGICTECFLQMKPSNASHPSQCPFCKTSSYAVEYRGARTEEEKGLELAEEQKVIEAKIRMQCQESQTVEQVMPADETCSCLDVQSLISCSAGSSTGDIQDVRNTGISLREGAEVDNSPVPNTCRPRCEEFDVDLEEIMVMEAIWQSLQDPTLQRSKTTETSGPSNTISPERVEEGSNKSEPCLSFFEQQEAASSESLTEGVAFAIARLAEHNTLHSEAVEPIYDSVESNPNQCEDSIEESDETGSEIECLANCSFTAEDDSGGSETAFASEEDIEAEADSGSCCSSALHSVSSTPCGGSPFPNDDAGRGCSQFPGLFVIERPMMIVMETNA